MWWESFHDPNRPKLIILLCLFQGIKNITSKLLIQLLFVNTGQQILIEGRIRKGDFGPGDIIDKNRYNFPSKHDQFGTTDCVYFVRTVAEYFC
jgi:hypothetical protein